MTTAELLGALEKRGVRLEVRGKSLTIDAPAGVVTSDMKRTLSENKGAILAELALRLAKPATLQHFPATAHSDELQ